jgi:hypothetical protein
MEESGVIEGTEVEGVQGIPRLEEVDDTVASPSTRGSPLISSNGAR